MAPVIDHCVREILERHGVGDTVQDEISEKIAEVSGVAEIRPGQRSAVNVSSDDNRANKHAA
jgi:hypothetical protein